MNDQKNTLLAIVLSAIVLIAWQFFFGFPLMQRQEAQKQALEMQILAREAELRSLKAQIDPHFLFNSLNSISALTAIDPAKARKMCQLLADFLRMSLAIGTKTLIPLVDEIALVSNYLAVEQIRLGPRLKVEKEIEDSCHGCRVPPLLLQPLIENAVHHGIAGLLEGGTVRIYCQKRGERLNVAIENPIDSDASAPAGKGIGLENVRSRLATFYGSEARLELRRGKSSFRVEISLPIQ